MLTAARSGPAGTKARWASRAARSGPPGRGARLADLPHGSSVWRRRARWASRGAWALRAHVWTQGW
jgi:hypothetical protein